MAVFSYAQHKPCKNRELKATLIATLVLILRCYLPGNTNNNHAASSWLSFHQIRSADPSRADVSDDAYGFVFASLRITFL